MKLRRILGSAAVVVAVLGTIAMGLYHWASRDSAPPDEAVLLPPMPHPPGQRYAEHALVALGREVVPLLPRIPSAYGPQTKTAADALLGEEVIQSLPGRMEAILKRQVDPQGVPVLAGTSGTPATDSDAEDGSDHDWARGVLAVSRVLRLRMQQQLADGQSGLAWRTASLGLAVSQLLHDRTTHLHHLAVVQAVWKLWFEAISAGLDAGLWSQPERRAIAALAAPAGQAERLLRGLRDEYWRFSRTIDQSFAALGEPRRDLVYQRNRTKRAWLQATAGVVAALRADDLLAARRALDSPEAAEVPDAIPLRNAVGYRMAQASVSGVKAPIDQAVAGSAQLKRIQERASVSR